MYVCVYTLLVSVWFECSCRDRRRKNLRQRALPRTQAASLLCMYVCMYACMVCIMKMNMYVCMQISPGPPLISHKSSMEVDAITNPPPSTGCPFLSFLYSSSDVTSKKSRAAEGQIALQNTKRTYIHTYIQYSSMQNRTRMRATARKFSSLRTSSSIALLKHLMYVCMHVSITYIYEVFMYVCMYVCMCV